MKYCSYTLSSEINVEKAYKRIQPYLSETPVIFSSSLNSILGHNHRIYFKVDSLQKTGAFKVRGVLNHLLILKEKGQLPSKIVAYSTGNHGIGVAWAARMLGIKSRVYLPKYTSKVKQKAANYYGSEVIFTENRIEAEKRAYSDQERGFYYMHPSDSDLTIAGAGTMCYEALKKMETKPDAIFAACGGGGLLSGSYLAKELLSPSSEIIGVEPLNANDAFLSVKNNEIFRFDNSPLTVADGLKTLGLSERTFSYIKKLDDLILVDEASICYWSAWIPHLLKVMCEPSAALNMEAVCYWLAKQESPKVVLVLISGGNIDPDFYKEISNSQLLLRSPSLSRENKKLLSLKNLRKI